MKSVLPPSQDMSFSMGNTGNCLKISFLSLEAAKVAWIRCEAGDGLFSKQSLSNLSEIGKYSQEEDRSYLSLNFDYETSLVSFKILVNLTSHNISLL